MTATLFLGLLWALPALVVVIGIASGRLNTTRAALLGLIVAIPVTLLTGPVDLGGEGLGRAMARGLWIGLTIAPYILGGLLFWQVAMPVRAPRAGSGKPAEGQQRGEPERQPEGRQRRPDDEEADGLSPIRRRRRLFFACFLIGPFAESATGFGVGMLGTVNLLRHFALAPSRLMVFALMSQTLIPWGGMGSGTMLAAAYARMPPAELGLYCLVPVALLLAAWLPLYWRCARQAGFAGGGIECLAEATWIMAGLVLLALATAWLGPETALLAAYAPLIALHFLLDRRPGAAELKAALVIVRPYGLLILVLVLTRLVPELRAALVAFGQLSPWDDLPTWSPFFHAGNWLVLGAIATAMARKRKAPQSVRLGAEIGTAWRTGRQATLTVFLFAMLAELLAAGGISQAAADALFATWQGAAILVTPLVAGGFGILANSGNAPNSLMMPAQLAMAGQAGLAVAAVAALQHVSGTSMSLFSPVRMSIAAQLAGGQGQERVAYGLILPFALAGFAVLLAVAAVIVRG